MNHKDNLRLYENVSVTRDLVAATAKAASADKHTVIRRLLGWPVRPALAARIDSALASAGVAHE